MAQLYGREWSREALLQHVGSLEQVARIQPCRLAGGRADGMSALEVDAGDGLRFTVLPDRCLDIPYFEYRGVPLVWHSRNGLVASEYYDPRGTEWLRSFFGGLLTTCGLTQVGPPCEDEGEALGLHGRIASTPAEHVRWGTTWHGDECELWVNGTMRETRVFGEDLRLFRSIATTLGGKSVRLYNRVENHGSQYAPLMILFHINAGFPVLAPGARLVVSDNRVEPRDERAREGQEAHAVIGPPQVGFAEQVYFHDVKTGTDGWAHCALVNDNLELPFGRGLGLRVSWRRDQMWNLNQWKQLGVGDYVLGMEPGNCLPEGRCAARQNGRLERIGPGKTREFEVEVGVLAGANEIAAFEQMLP